MRIDGLENVAGQEERKGEAGQAGEPVCEKHQPYPGTVLGTPPSLGVCLVSESGLWVPSPACQSTPHLSGS